MIRSQLNSTPLGKWVGKGHQRWKNYCDSQNNIIEKESDADTSGLTPVGITRRRIVRIIGKQNICKNMEIPHRNTSPGDSLKHPAPWILKLWSGYKWDENMVTKIMELVNTNSLKAIGSGAIRDQWGSFAFSFMSKYEKKI